MITTSLKAIALLILGASALTAAPQAAQANDLSSDDTLQIAAESQLLLAGDEMESRRGAFGMNELTSEQMLSAATTGNSLNVGGNMTNGNITVGDNMGGFGSYVMNTGNNSTINSAVSLNIQIMQSP